MSSLIIFAVVVIVAMVVKAKNKKTNQTGGPNARLANPRVQKMIEKIQAQNGNMPIQFRGQIIQPPAGQAPPPGQVVNSAGQIVRPAGPVQDPGRAQASAQLSGMLQQLMQSGQSAGHFGQRITGPGQYQQGQNQQGQYQQQGPPPQQYPGPQTGYAPPGQFAQPGWIQPPPPPAYQQPARRPQQGKAELDARIRELMSTGNEVTAVRLLSDERDLGIIEAQKYARSLVAGPEKARGTTASARPANGKSDEEPRYVGSAAFAESVFSTRDDDNVWASGWVDKPEADDRSDIDELWDTVKNAGRPAPPKN